MSGKVFLLPFAFLLFSSFGKYTPEPVSFPKILLLYRQADRFYNATNNSAHTDSLAMFGFKDVSDRLLVWPAEKKRDSLLFQVSFKLGILYEVNKNFPDATSAYLRALTFATHAEEKFRLMVFAGAGYYNLNNFDSASYFLLKAAASPVIPGTEQDRMRLFNTLGVLYYDNGNYLQSKNYFNQALELIPEKTQVSKLHAYSIELNLGTCFMKLGWYEQALSIYKKALGYPIVPDPLYMNMGRAYAGLNQYTEAMNAFKKVSVTELPGVLNEMAAMAMVTGHLDSAATWLSAYRDKKKFPHTNMLDDGVNEQYTGNLNLLHGNADSALCYLQYALTAFSGSFTDKNIRKNPVSFTGAFAFYRVFEVLVKKAEAWELKYKKTGRPDDLMSSFDTYQSAIALLSYIERSYETDDAKLLLKQKSGEVFTHAMEVCLHLHQIFPKQKFLEEAFLISEKNKATVMTAQIGERNLMLKSGSDKDLSGEERNIKFNIARLNTRYDEEKDLDNLKNISEQKARYETQLVNIRRKMEGNKRFYQLKYSDDFPSVGKLQSAINPGTALISFYNEPDRILVFVLTTDHLTHLRLDSGIRIRSMLQSWIQSLQTAENGRHSETRRLKDSLFSAFVKPLQKLAGDKEEWIVIPDGIFFQLPLESLPSSLKGGYLLSDHAVSYEFSSRFILETGGILSDAQTVYPVLSFAPFSQKGMEMNKNETGWLQKLPYSKEEISGLLGSHFMDEAATKSAFVKNLNDFPIVHLATHAVTDMENPSGSFIAFSSKENYRPDDFLFLDEIYSFNMDSCRMLILSACETGRGELVKNEGAMSFARAFLYAGCPSTVNTLWKADDRSTSEIFRLFYKYLERGDSKSKALQKAKIEFIKNNPVIRDPAYWSHIILTGDPAPLYKKKQPWLWAVWGISAGLALLFFFKKMKRKPVRFSV